MILNILNELAADNSRLAKEAILMRERTHETLKMVFKAALDPYIVYGIKKIPEYHRRADSNTFNLTMGVDQLKHLSSRKFTGHAAIEHLQYILECSEPFDAEVIERIINRDLRCGVQESTVNKIWPGLIPTFDVLLCHKDTSGIKYPAIAQEKSDGCRIHIRYDGESCRGFTRTGKELDLGFDILESAKHLMNPGETWDGELLCYKDGKPMDRKSGNGIILKAQKGTVSLAEQASFRVMVWDIVDFTSTIKYQDRFNDLASRFKEVHKGSSFILIPSVVVASEEEAQSFYLRMRKLGKEGAIIKNFDGVWEGKRVKSSGKMKAVESADVRITGVVEGTGKYAGMLGSFEYATDDGVVTGNVGTGLTDDDRKRLFDQKYVGQVAELLYNEKIQSKDGSWSLFLPRFVEIRFDKDVTNTFEELK